MQFLQSTKMPDETFGRVTGLQRTKKWLHTKKKRIAVNSESKFQKPRDRRLIEVYCWRKMTATVSLAVIRDVTETTNKDTSVFRILPVYRQLIYWQPFYFPWRLPMNIYKNVEKIATFQNLSWSFGSHAFDFYFCMRIWQKENTPPTRQVIIYAKNQSMYEFKRIKWRYAFSGFLFRQPRF